MQKNVNVVKVLETVFEGRKANIKYDVAKINVEEIYGVQLLKLCELELIFGVKIKRSGPGLVILVAMQVKGTPAEVQKYLEKYPEFAMV